MNKIELSELENKVLNTIKDYDLINGQDKIVLGVSGGPDSICMLDIIYNFYKNGILGTEKNSRGNKTSIENLVVAHVNHMIRTEAKDDEIYVRNFCEEKGIDFYSKSIDVQDLANNNKIGTEEAGRKVRYEFFDEVMEKTNANKIAIAHNKNDNVETIFMHILRGSGINGLKGIEPKRGKYIRPLIECGRSEIEQYCKEKGLEPRTDKTNFENTYTRNKIRNVVIPYVKKEFNPNIIETIDRLSKIVKSEEEYINNQVKIIYERLFIEQNQKQIVLDLKKFNNQEEVIKSRVLLYTITRLLGNSNGIENIHIKDILKLCNNNIGNKFLTPNKNIKILVKNHKIYFISQD